MVGLVETMLKLHKDLPNAKTPHEQESLRRQIAATDKEIDALVHELYGLTHKEIRIVEGGEDDVQSNSGSGPNILMSPKPRRIRLTPGERNP